MQQVGETTRRQIDLYAKLGVIPPASLHWLGNSGCPVIEASILGNGHLLADELLYHGFTIDRMQIGFGIFYLRWHSGKEASFRANSSSDPAAATCKSGISS